MLETFLLRSEKFDIKTFIDPEVAIREIKHNRYDLILLDIMMPQMDGIDFLEQIKKLQPNIKVIMMTAYSTMDKVIDSNKIGADDYVTKPFISLRDIENKVFDQLGF
jgi:DNA-binding response OmpR family regulator